MALNDVEQRLGEWIAVRGAAMRGELARHVAIPTGWNHAPGLDAYRALVRARLERLGAAIEMAPGDARPEWLDYSGKAMKAGAPAPGGPNIPPVMVARKRPAAGNLARVLIVGHLDTVHDPNGAFRELTISQDGGTGTGPGAVDMKGGIVIALEALDALHACGVDVHWTFALNSDEETGSFHSAATLRALAREHDIGIVLEPALPGGKLVIERMGSGSFRVDVHGKAAHAGRDFEKGVSAVNRLAEAVVELSRASDPKNGMMLNVGPLKGGDATNVVADHAACWGNVRFADRAKGDALAAAIDRIATDEKAMPRVVVHRDLSRPAKLKTPAVVALAETYRDVAAEFGQRVEFASTGGVCDGNLLQDEGLPTLDSLGVRGGNLHRTDEFVDLAGMVDRCQTLAVFMARIASGLK